MITKILTIHSIETLVEWIRFSDIKNTSKRFKSVFIQIFASERDPKWMMDIEATLRQVIPQGVIVGASSMGEIAEGQLQINATVISFAFFEKTLLQGILISGENGAEAVLGKQLARKIENNCHGVAGVMLLATPYTMDVSEFLKGFSAGRRDNYPVFGGGAGDYEAVQEPLISLNNEHTSRGALAVVFIGDDIHIDIHTYLGWQPLSKEMIITETDGLWIKKIDDQPAFDVFYRYLDIQNDEDFFYNVLEFPLLLKRNSIEYAKTPMEVNANNEIKFITKIDEGESVCIGYGNPAVMIEKAKDIQNRIQIFNPEAIFLYSCICRRYLLQSEVDLETKPFETIAPTAGFYTFGEICSLGREVVMLNATMLAVSLKEGQGKRPAVGFENRNVKTEPLDPFTSQHTRIISRLVNFIKVVTEELEEANAETKRLAERDYLTQAYNRMKAHQFIENEIERCNRYDLEFSAIMLDMDFFKKVNDTYGHNVGDEILIHLVKLLTLEIRKIDMLSRWGGEEFLIVMPLTDLEGARITAERIRAIIELTFFPRNLSQTCSFGVTAYKKNESIEMFVDRVDKALYEAKRLGRNCVVTK